MSIIKNKKGIGIPTVLGIVTFVIATVATLLTVAVNQSKSFHFLCKCSFLKMDHMQLE